MSYAAILGSVTCTIIGTSTNLVVNSLLIAEENTAGLAFLKSPGVGVPSALQQFRLYPAVRGSFIAGTQTGDRELSGSREYTVEVTVEEGSALVGKTVEEAGLRHLDGLYLVEIERDQRIIAAVGSHERLQTRDRLVFAGVTESVVELQRIKGLRPSAEQAFDLKTVYPERCLVEAVVAPQCPLVGETIRESRFRTLYGASVIAVARDGERIRGKLGDIRLQPADALLLETRPSFIERHRNSRSFLLISPVADSSQPRHERAWVSWAILASVVLAVSLGGLSMLVAAMLGAALTLLCGCCTVTIAQRSIDTQVLLAIASAFALGKALEVTGAAAFIAHGLVGWAGEHPWLVLIGVYCTTSLLTEIITNNAVAVLMFPIVVAASAALRSVPCPL
ncbi:MAG: SLC13 family permease [Candidatus Competibacteraceae bacterium]